MRGKQERRLKGRVARRVEEHVVDVPVFEVMRKDQQERVQETTAEQVVTAAEVFASAVVESADGCEDRPQGVEVPVFVSRDRIQRLARAACWLDEFVIKVVPRDNIQQRTFKQFADFPEGVLFWYLSREEFQLRDKLNQLMNVPKTVLQDGVQR